MKRNHYLQPARACIRLAGLRVLNPHARGDRKFARHHRFDQSGRQRRSAMLAISKPERQRWKL